MSYTMGLYAVPKFEGCGVGEAYTVENYLEALRLGESDDTDIAAYGFKGSFVEWYLSGKELKQDDVARITAEVEEVYTPEMLEFYKGHYRELYWPWDFKKMFPRYRIAEEVASWKNAYQISDWFFNNLKKQGGFYMVTKEDVVKLLNICTRVLEDNSLAPELLPINEEDGCYDDSYFEEIESTVRKLNRVLVKVDFDKNMVHFDFD